MFYVYNKQFFRDGMLFLEMLVSDLQRNVQPSVEEKAFFADKKTIAPEDIFGGDGLNSEKGDKFQFDGNYDNALNGNEEGNEEEVEGKRGKAMMFFKGDKIRVILGELKGLEGVVEESDIMRGEVHITVTVGDNFESLILKENEIIKRFSVGMHVKVIAGQYAGETGIVVVCDDDDGHGNSTASANENENDVDNIGRVIVLSDFGDKEMKVFVNHLIESAEVSIGMKSVEGFELGDLVSVGNVVDDGLVY